MVQTALILGLARMALSMFFYFADQNNLTEEEQEELYKSELEKFKLNKPEDLITHEVE